MLYWMNDDKLIGNSGLPIEVSASDDIFRISHRPWLLIENDDIVIARGDTNIGSGPYGLIFLSRKIDVY